MTKKKPTFKKPSHWHIPTELVAYQVLNADGYPANIHDGDLCLFETNKAAKAYIKYLWDLWGEVAKGTPPADYFSIRKYKITMEEV